jgi:Undecaprenyl-phosphate glucose phosphotransferase
MALVQPINADLAPASSAHRRGPLRPAALSSTRRRIEAPAVRRLFAWSDVVLLVSMSLIALCAGGMPLMTRPIGQVLPLVVGSLTAISILQASRLYSFPPRRTLTLHLARIACVVVAASAMAMLTTLLAPEWRATTSNWTAGLALVLLAAHAGWWSRVEAWRKAGRLTPNVVVVGATPNAQRLIEAALKTRDIAILGVFDDRAARAPGDVAGVPVLGDTNALMSHPLLPFVDRIVITVPPSAQTRVRGLIDRLRVLPNAVTLFMDVDGAEARDATLSRLASSSIAQVCGSEQDERRAFAKRVQDLVIGTAALVVALPIMAVIALLVKLDSPGPALFRQRRHGFNNEVITVWKFRSMRVEAADATAARQVSKDDDRVTRVGRVIRKLSLDELPQLINVVRGEMSLIGPRPHAIGMKTAGEESAKLVAEYAWRHRMKPGLSGWAQINGSIGAVDTPEAVRRRVALDIEYIESQSFWFDLYILFMTVPALVMARNTVR